MQKTFENNILAAFGMLCGILLALPFVLTFRLFSKLFKKAKNEKNKK